MTAEASLVAVPVAGSMENHTGSPAPKMSSVCQSMVPCPTLETLRIFSVEKEPNRRTVGTTTSWGGDTVRVMTTETVSVVAPSSIWFKETVAV